MDRLMIGLGQPHALLDTQYRMHPAISAFPAAHFYGGRLKDDPSTLSRSEAPLRLGPLASLGPLALLHVRGAREEAARDGSVRNMAEAAAICELLLELRGRGVDVRSASRVKAPPLHAMTPLALSLASLALPSPRAPPSRLSRDSRARTPSSSPPPSPPQVLTFYAAQVAAIRAAADARGLRGVFIATVDGAQGSEADVVLLSCVRCRGVVGFLADERRLNVGLTRCDGGLWTADAIDQLLVCCRVVRTEEVGACQMHLSPRRCWT